MFFNERCLELRDIADLFEQRGEKLNAQFLLETVEYMNTMNNRICELQDVIQDVLNDSETQEGVWGPDVTMIERLQAVMPKVVMPN